MHVGIVGGGQLGRMLVQAGIPLGFRFTILDGAVDASAGQIAPLIQADFGDHGALARLAETVDVVTFDFENVPADAADWLAGQVPVRPATKALRIAQDRIEEKRLFETLGIPTTRHAPVHDEASLEQALSETGLPAVLKTRRLGYDGKGQRILYTREDAATAMQALGESLILESFVDYQRELSVIAARGQDGEVACYPLAENTHRSGILHSSVAPAPDASVENTAQEYAARLLGHLDYVGVLALELFETRDGLLANEFAPRVHNSGHWTIEGAVTSQFENHLRAIAGLPLGDTAARGCAAMVNFIGQMPPMEDVLAIPGAHLHDYRKVPRPGRKLGHATVTAGTRDALAPLLERLESLAKS